MQKCLWYVPHHKHWSDLRCRRHLVSNPSSGRACRGLFPVLLIKKYIFCDAVAWSSRTAVYAGRPCLHEVHHLAAKGSRHLQRAMQVLVTGIFLIKTNRQLLQQDVAPIVTILPVQAALVAAKDSLISTCAKNKYGDSVTAGNGLSCKRQHS